MRNLILMIAVFTTFTACNKDGETGNVTFEITDAPIDDASVESAFVTVADIKVDGMSVEGFNKTTIDLLAYQNGSTKLLTDAELEANTYSEVTLVLDYETDQDGNSPGCYIKKTGDETRHELSSSSNELQMDYTLDVAAETQSAVVMDFDLRKCVTRDETTAGSYQFVSESELESGIRVVSKDSAGVIDGNCDYANTGSEKVVVFAYSKGSFNESEMNQHGQSNIRFPNAVASAAVDASGNYELHFLEQGDYELHYASYKENTSGEMELEGKLTLDIIGSIHHNSVTVEASSSVTVNVLATGLIPL